MWREAERWFILHIYKRPLISLFSSSMCLYSTIHALPNSSECLITGHKVLAALMSRTSSTILNDTYRLAIVYVGSSHTIFIIFRWFEWYLDGVFKYVCTHRHFRMRSSDQLIQRWRDCIDLHSPSATLQELSKGLRMYRFYHGSLYKTVFSRTNGRHKYSLSLQMTYHLTGLSHQ